MSENLQEKAENELTQSDNSGEFKQIPLINHVPSASIQLLNNEPKERQTFWNIFRHHFICYCETTSLRGVPKIVKSRDWKRRLLWSCFVFGFFVGCVMCLAFMVVQFLSYDVIHQTRTINGEPTEFPAFTLCNARSMSSSGIQLLKNKGFMDPQGFNSKLLDMAKQLRSHRSAIKKPLQNYEKEAISSALSLSGYLRLINQSGVNLEQVGHNLSTTVIQCKAITERGKYIKEESCDDIGGWVRVFSEYYINCYSFRAHNKDKSMTIKHIEIYVYLEDREAVYCKDCNMMQLPSQLSGVRVELHTSGTYPQIYENGMNLRPGTFTEVRFKTKQWHMMEPPYGKCLKKGSPSIILDGVSFNFSQEACRMAEVQAAIMNECKCKEFRLPIREKDLEVARDLQWCGIVPRNQINATEDPNRSVSLTYNEDLVAFIKGQQCSTNMFRTLVDYEKDIKSITNVYKKKVAQCHTACEYYSYDNSISSTKWPTTSFHTQFKKLLEMVRNKAIQRREQKKPTSNDPDVINHILQQMTVYEEIEKVQNRSQAEAWKMLSNTDFIERNFLSIIVSRSDFDIARVEEKAVFTLTSLLSQSGGLLSIWIGLTFICIVEVIELFLNIFDSYTGQKKY